MAEAASDTMIEELVVAGRCATEFHAEGRVEEEVEVLEFMDALWDRMSWEEREQGEAALREARLHKMVARIVAGKNELF